MDGEDPAANADDDLAIDPTKQMLRDGYQASAANYTDYARGLNGLMLDVAHLSGTPQVSDFVFQVGNTLDPSTWSTAPAPLSITVRAAREKMAPIGSPCSGPTMPLRISGCRSPCSPICTAAN